MSQLHDSCSIYTITSKIGHKSNIYCLFNPLCIFLSYNLKLYCTQVHGFLPLLKYSLALTAAVGCRSVVGSSDCFSRPKFFC